LDFILFIVANVLYSLLLLLVFLLETSFYRRVMARLWDMVAQGAFRHLIPVFKVVFS